MSHHGPPETIYPPPVAGGTAGLTSQLSSISLSSQPAQANSSSELNIVSQNEPPVFTAPPIATVSPLSKFG